MCEYRHTPVYGAEAKFQSDPHWRDNFSLYKYSHGDNSAAIGASHQTGWTGLIGGLLEMFGRLDPQRIPAEGRMSSSERVRFLAPPVRADAVLSFL